MKKITLTSLAVLAMLAISCEKNSVTNENKDNDKTEVLPENYISLTFGTKTEEIVSKTALNNSKIEWAVGDKVKVLFDGGSTETEAEKAGIYTDFTVKVPSDASSIYLAYPSSEGITLNDGALTLTIPAETDGSFEKANYMLCSALPTDEEITFYHAGSIFKVEVADATITKAVITGNDGEALAGTVTYTFGEKGLSYGDASETSTSLTMNFNGAGTYYASALPGLTLEKGATIKFFRGENPAGGNCVASAIPVTRACVASFGKDVEMCNRYVSTSGTGEGNGRTAETAWNLSQFADFVSNKGAMSSEKLSALNGLTVHLAAGTYDLENALDFNLGSEVKTFNVIAEEGTVLNGNGHQILVQNRATRDNTTLVFDNVTFKGGVCDTDHGGAIKHSYGKIVYKNCIFRDNNVTQEDKEKNGNGGIFNLYSKAIAELENCKFYNNTSKQNGAVAYVSNDNNSITFTNCEFGDGTEANKNHAVLGGGVIHIKKGKATFNGCTFNMNKTDEYGGAIYLSSDCTGSATVSNCTFTGNESKNGGAIYLSDKCTGTVDVSNCTFTGNKASNGGALGIYGGTFSDKGSAFYKNSATWGGATIIQNSATVTLEGSKFGKEGDSDKKNTAEKGGGAININGGTITLTKCEFYSNQATGSSGGAIRRAQDNDGVQLTIKGCTFKENISKLNEAGGGGGAIHFEKNTMTITQADDGTRNTFENNSTIYRGGAINVDGDAVASISDCDFISNTTTGTTGSFRHWGGAVCIDYNANATLTNCVFDRNESATRGGALAGIGCASTIKLNQCIFKDNKATHGAAISNTAKGAVYYLNACVFTGNNTTSTYGVVIHFGNNDNNKGGTTKAGSGTLCMNNVTFADNNYCTANNVTAQQACWVNLKGLDKAVLSNSTLIGTNRKSATAPVNSDRLTDPNLYRFDGKVGSGNYLINSIIAQTPTSGTYYSSDIKGSPVKGYYSKLSTLLNGSTFTNEGGCATDYKGTSSYFGGLNYVAGANPSWNNCYWSWNGTLATGSNTDMATLDNVNKTIKTADEGFHTWLSEIGALNIDGRGKQRGTTTWPGSYDGTNN